MEISPALILCIYFNVTSFVLHWELKWAGLQRAGVALISTAVSYCLEPVLTFPPSETPGNTKKDS